MEKAERSRNRQPLVQRAVDDGGAEVGHAEIDVPGTMCGIDNHDRAALRRPLPDPLDRQDERGGRRDEAGHDDVESAADLSLEFVQDLVGRIDRIVEVHQLNGSTVTGGRNLPRANHRWVFGVGHRDAQPAMATHRRRHRR